MNPVITILPRGKLRLIDCIDAAHDAGQQVYQRRGVLVAAKSKPGASWHRLGILRRVA